MSQTWTFESEQASYASVTFSVMLTALQHHSQLAATTYFVYEMLYPALRILA